MESLKETVYFDKIIKELNYSFADVYIFEGFVVSEIKEGITFSWEENAKIIIDDVVECLGSNGDDLIYISHRIYSYSVIASDWVKFFKMSYGLKGYGVVGYNNTSFLNSMVEKLFFKKKIKHFTELDSAIDWATNKVLTELSA